MGDAAIHPTLPDAGAEPDFHPSVRERLGVVAFVMVAVAATLAWVGVIAWAIVKLVEQI